MFIVGTILILFVFFSTTSRADSGIRLIVINDTLYPVLNMESVVPLEVKTDPLFETIAMCESGNNPAARNGHSTAGGRFQFLIGSWNYYGEQLWGDELSTKDRFNYEDNTELAWYTYTTIGTSPWDASKACWQKMV